MMEFLHLPNRRDSYILRESIYATTFEIPPLVSESRGRQNSLPVPRYHHGPDWPWHHEASAGNDQYVLSPDEQYFEHQEFPTQFGHGDTNRFPFGASSPGSNRGSFPFPQFNVHNRNSTRSRNPHVPFQSNHARFGFHQQHRRHNRHHHGFPTNLRETVPPQIFEPSGVAVPAAYSVEEPTTPPAATRSPNFPNTNPHHQSQQQRTRSESPDVCHPWQHHRPRQSSPLDDRAYLPPRTQRCETLPSSASSTTPSTPSQCPSSPASASASASASNPRPNSPVLDFSHAMPDHNSHSRTSNSHDSHDANPYNHPSHPTHSLLSAQRRALLIQHRQLCAMRRELDRLNGRSLRGGSGRGRGPRHAWWGDASGSGSGSGGESGSGDGG